MEEHREQLDKVKASENKQQKCFSILNWVFFGICIISGFSFVFCYQNPTIFVFFVPVTWFLNVAIIIVVFKMRTMIQKTPYLIVNDTNFILHQFIFGVYTVFWSILRVLQTIQDHLFAVNYECEHQIPANQEEILESQLNFYNALARRHRMQFAYLPMLLILNSFILYKLHVFSTSKPTRFDPVTRQELPTLMLL